MAKVAITEQYLTDIADAIRSKTGLSSTFLPAEMAPAILTISGSGGITPSGTINITSNNTYDVTRYASAVVNVPVGSTINNQNKTVTPTETSQSITYDTGYTGLGVVTVGAISDTYVGSAIDVNPTITISGATVTIPSGYYNAQQSESVATTTHPKPTASVNSTTGLVTASHTQTAGYVSAGTTTGTLQLTTQAGATITPTDSSQTAVAAGRYTLGAITVAAVPEETKTITVNGTYTPSEGNWFSSVTVNVPTGSSINNQDKTVTPTKSQQLISADSGYTGLGTVTVNAIPSQYIVPNGNLAITANGTDIDVTQYASVSVDVPVGSTINNQNKTVTPIESQQTITADEGYTGLGTVTVNAISSTYVGSDIVARDGDDLTVSGATVSVPAGYYAEAASKSVASGTEGTPTASKSTVSNHSITVTPSVTNTAGYISGGTHSGTVVTVSASELVSGTYSVTASGTHNVTNYASASVAAGSATAPSTISGTAASVSTGSGTLTLTKTVSITPTVSAGYISSGTAGNASISLTTNVTVNPTLTVNGPTVTAPAGYYTESASKSVATMTPPSEPSNNYTSGYTRLKVIGRATSTRYINIPPGYNSTGVYYQISAVYDGHATTPATTITANPTITISDSGLITATTSASQSVTPTVSAGYVSSGTAGTITVSGSKTQQLTTKAAATITPTTTNQTIASGTYLTGTQTILGDANLVGSNIIAGTSIFGTNGTATFQSYYTGSSAPASSLGNNGDIYLQE